MPSASMSTMRACGSNPPLRPSAYLRVFGLRRPCRTPTEPRLPIPRGLPSSVPSTLRRSLPLSSMTNRGRRSRNSGSMYVSHRSTGSRMWPSASITLYTRVIGNPSLDHALRLQLRQLLGAEPAHLAEDLRVVLAEERGARHLRRRRRKPDRTGRRRHAPARRMLDVHDHAAAPEVLVRHHLVGVEDGTAGDAGGAEPRHHLVLVAL